MQGGTNSKFGNKLSIEMPLRSGQYLVSQNGQFYALMQTDGNFVVYNGPHFYQSQYAIWASGSYQGGSSRYQLFIHLDGNLAIYNQVKNRIWEANTQSPSNPYYYLSISNDGALQIKDQQNHSIWSSIKGFNSTLDRGSCLISGEFIRSSNGTYFAVMEADGNFVVYNRPIFSSQYAIWDAGIHKAVSQYTLKMETDGNLFIYSDNDPIWGLPIMSPIPNPIYHLSISNDGSLQIKDQYNLLLWSSTKGFKSTLDSGSCLMSGEFIRSPSSMYFAVMEADGNFVVHYGASTGAQNSIWSSKSQQTIQSNYFIIMQTNGNLVIYDQITPIWESKISWRPNPVNFHLSLLDNGILTIYDEKDQPVWTSQP